MLQEVCPLQSVVTLHPLYIYHFVFVYVYRNGDGVGKDGQVALDYGKKALTVANNRSETIDAYNGMLSEHHPISFYD